MVMAIAATVTVVVKTAVVAPSIAMTHAQVPRPQPTPTTAAHLATRVLVVQRVPSKVMTRHVKAVVIHAAVAATVAMKVTAGKTALKAHRQPTLSRALKLQAALRKHHVHRKVHALKLALPRKRMIKSTCKTAQKVSPALKTTTIVAIQNANAVVVVVVVANVVKTKVQALRTKMVHQTCNRPSRTLSQWMA